MVRLYASQRAAGEPLESLVLDLRDNPGEHFLDTS